MYQQVINFIDAKDHQNESCTYPEYGANWREHIPGYKIINDPDQDARKPKPWVPASCPAI